MNGNIIDVYSNIDELKAIEIAHIILRYENTNFYNTYENYCIKTNDDETIELTPRGQAEFNRILESVKNILLQNLLKERKEAKRS